MNQSGHRPVQVLDLFSGCGGLSAGFALVGELTGALRLAGAADLDAHATSTYAANLGVEPATVDLAESARSDRAFDALLEHFSYRASEPTILIGGPPCQGFSAHRKKDGTRPADARNELVAVFARLAVRLNPEFIVFENVPEVLARKHWRRFLALRATLEAAGYSVRAQFHNLAGFGVPQERYRALVIASRVPFAMPAPFLAPQQYLTVRSAIGALPGIAPGEPDADDPMHFCTRHRESTIRTIRQVPKDGGSRPKGVGPSCLDRVDGFRDVYGRLYWDRPANTVTAYARNPASGRYAHPDQDRGLSVREAALLQGFPSQFRFEGPFDTKYQQIGNAVPPAFAAYLAAHVLGEMCSSRIGIAPNETESSDVRTPMSNSFSSGIAGRKKGAR